MALEIVLFLPGSMNYSGAMKFPTFVKSTLSLCALVASLTGLTVNAATPAQSKTVKVLPVDEAAQDPEFLMFRNRLLAAIKQRDLNAVVAVAAEDIKLSFGGSYGHAEFRQNLVADDNGAGGSYWSELEWALELGGVFNDEHGRQFCTPYVSCSGPHQCADCDPFETLVAVSDRAPVHAEPETTAPVLAHLSYDVVTLIDYGSPWRKVRLADGRTGYVTFPTFRSPIGYRAYFEKRDGRWQMRIFIAGD